MTGSSCTLAQLRLIFKMRGIAGQISPPSQNGVTAKHSGKMTLSGCLFYTSANVKWGSDIKRSHFECGAKCSREALSYWLNPVMLNVSTDRAKELQVYKLDMINVFFFQHSERHEPIGMKREHRVLTKDEVRTRGFCWKKKASKRGSLYCDDPSSKASPDILKYNTSFCDFFAVH